MSPEIASLIVAAAGVYFAIGAVFALWFVTMGVSRIDPGAKGMALQARAIIFPGVMGLWPLMLAKSLTQKAPPVS
jgi:hypothetical protein